MLQSYYIFDKETDNLLEELRNDFGAPTKAQVVRKALGLATVVARLSNKTDHTAILVDTNGKEHKILLSE